MPSHTEGRSSPAAEEIEHKIRLLREYSDEDDADVTGDHNIVATPECDCTS